MKHKRILSRSNRTALFLAPSFLGVALFFIIPFFVVIYYSVVSSPINGAFVGLDNYRNLLHNSAFLLAAKNTAILIFVAVPLAVLLSLLLALALDRAMPLRSHLRTAFLSPIFVPVASVVLVWQVFFHDNGLLNALLPSSVDWFHSGASRIMVISLYLWKNVGFNMLLFTAALASIPRNVLEMAQLDGAGRVKQFFRIKIFYLGSTTVFVTIMSLISAMKIFREVYLLTGDYPGESLYLLQHFMNNTFQSMDYQKLCSAAVLLSAVMCALIAILLRVDKRLGKDVENA